MTTLPTAGRYIMRPTFISNPTRAVKHTREVLVKGVDLDSWQGNVRVPLVLIEELTDGPANHHRLSGKLWDKGEHKALEFNKWEFVNVTDEGKEPNMSMSLNAAKSGGGTANPPTGIWQTVMDFAYMEATGTFKFNIAKARHNDGEKVSAKDGKKLAEVIRSRAIQLLLLADEIEKLGAFTID